VKRTLAVTFCLGLLLTLAVVFTRVIAARVPEQRATLEKLITERTGLEVRFENVRFAWDLDGTSAVFTRVELTDPQQGRVHVLAPELRVEFDAWDFLRHHRFSLGHVTLVSPDIEIIVDPERSLVDAMTPRDAAPRRVTRADGESALVHRYLGWTGLMPSGRIEVEGARVHLRHRGDRAAHRSFTLSQGVVSRTGGGFSAYGTMLLSQDVGQSLFVSVKLEGLGSAAGMSGELRFIARRVFLDKIPDALPLAGVGGRGTLDARLSLRHGRVESGTWQANARELAMNDATTRFDHLTLNGRLTRIRDDLLLDFTDLQLTRGARLERAPAVTARLHLAPDSMRVARTTVTAERIPFMAAEFVTSLLAPRLAAAAPKLPGGWAPTSGELHELRFDSGDRLQSKDAWELTARVAKLDLTRATDQAMLGQLGGQLDCDAGGFSLLLDAEHGAQWRVAAMQEPRPLRLEGKVAMLSGDGGWRFEKLTASSADATWSLDGDWQPTAKRERPLRVTVAQLDRGLLAELWPLFDAESPLPEPLAMLEQGIVSEGSAELLPSRSGGVNWSRSRGTLLLTALASSGEDMPRLTDGSGKLEFARGGTKLAFDGGRVEDLAITAARIEWPRSGAPRLHALLEGRMESPLLQGVLEAQGLAKLSGAVKLETDARGEQALRRPELWRVSARVSEATLPLARGLPPVEKLGGTIRYAQQLRGLSLQGRWLGGDVAVESRRGSARGSPGFTVSGTADATAVLALTGGTAAADRITGQLAWNGTLQPLAEGTSQISLTSNLAGVESTLPAPFDKRRARELPVRAELRLGPEGIRDFSIDGRDVEVRGQVRAGVTRASFEVQGVSGQWNLAAGRGAKPHVRIEALDLRRAPAVLAAAASTLPPDGELELSVADLQYADRSFGLLQASLVRQDDGLDFSMDTSALAQHQLAARGRCDPQGRCRADFSADTAQLATLLRDVQLPEEWPLASLRASGALEWPLDSTDIPRSMSGSFELQTRGSNPDHQLSARATLADGEVMLADVQGTGPEADQVFRGTGRIGLLARNYDLTLDYERVALAAAAVPPPARERFARAWNALRGSAARRGWTEAPETRRVQWHGTWD
jgi:hypothetical protein